jgi:chromosome segregation ATPase
MTVQSVLDRGLVRGRSIWPAFKYQVPGLLAVHISERAVVFGIYSGAYLHGYSYLKEVTYETLAQMVLAYDQAMAELTADEQRSVIDVTAKRYIEEQNLAAKDAALRNKERKIEQKASEVNAKVDALESDRQALATKVTELEVAQSKANTLIKELKTKIEEQVLENAQVEAEITRQQLIAKKAELDVIETGIRALEIQAQIAEAAYRLASVGIKRTELESDIDRIALDTAEVDVRKAQTEADTARLKTQKETESLAESELTVAQAETDAYRQETELLKGKGPLLDQRIEAAEAEIADTIPKLAQVIEDEKNADLTAQESKNQHMIAEYENRTLGYKEKVKTSNALTDLEMDNHEAEGKMIEENADGRADYDSARVWANAEKIAGAEQAADIMAKANIVNTLTHQIGATK